MVHKIKAFGEEKTLADWSKDKRCQVSYGILYYRIVKHGRDPEWSISSSPRVGINTRLIEAFGEKKTLASWLRDKRCKVTRNAIINRLKKGWNTETAISTEPSNRRAERGREDRIYYVTAFGVCKSPLEWSRDPRCKVSRQGLIYRLTILHMKPELAISIPSSKKKQWKTKPKNGGSCMAVSQNNESGKSD